MGLLMLNGIPYSGFTEPSNIYSTTEREVGVWIDGKPVYEKTVDLGSNVLIPSTTWTDINILKNGIDLILNIVGTNTTGTVWNSLNANRDSNSDYIQVFNLRNTDIAFRYVTFQYTKTSDVPGSGKYAPDGSVMHHYSTDEHVIGTWINGKTLYEKTALISNIQVPSNNYALITLSDYFSNVSKVINYECMTDTGDPIPKIYIDSSDVPYSTSAIIELYSDAIIFSRGGGGSTTFNAYVTLRYTKSS